MESMTSIAPSVGSTTAMGLEDDANNFSMVFLCHITHVSSVRVTLDLSSNNIDRSKRDSAYMMKIVTAHRKEPVAYPRV